MNINIHYYRAGINMDQMMSSVGMYTHMHALII